MEEIYLQKIIRKEAAQHARDLQKQFQDRRALKEELRTQSTKFKGKELKAKTDAELAKCEENALARAEYIQTEKEYWDKLSEEEDRRRKFQLQKDKEKKELGIQNSRAEAKKWRALAKEQEEKALLEKQELVRRMRNQTEQDMVHSKMRRKENAARNRQAVIEARNKIRAAQDLASQKKEREFKEAHAKAELEAKTKREADKARLEKLKAMTAKLFGVAKPLAPKSKLAISMLQAAKLQKSKMNKIEANEKDFAQRKYLKANLSSFGRKDSSVKSKFKLKKLKSNSKKSAEQLKKEHTELKQQLDEMESKRADIAAKKIQEKN